MKKMKKVSLFLAIFGLASSSLLANEFLNKQNNLETNEFVNPLPVKRAYYEITVLASFSLDFNIISQTVYTEKGWFTQAELEARMAALQNQYISNNSTGSGTKYMFFYNKVNPPLVFPAS